MLHNLQRVEEELQSSDTLVAPPIPLRSNLTQFSAAAAAADDATADSRDATEDQYLELQPDDLYEQADVIQPVRKLHVLPGQVSMPESSLPPSIMLRKPSCPDAATARRAPKPLPQTPEETGRSMDSVKFKKSDPPPVAIRK